MKKKLAVLATMQAFARSLVSWNSRGRRFELDEVLGPRSPRGNNILPVTFDGGFNNLDRAHPLSMYGQGAPWRWHTYFNDFDQYVAGDWTVTETQAGATQALTDEDGGALLLTNSAADDDLNLVQLLKESFKYEAGKPLMFGARLKISDATQSDIVAGLQIRDATPLDVTDGFFWQKDDGDAFLDFHVEKNNVATDAIAVASIVADTYVTLQWAYDGERQIYYGIDGVTKGSTALTNVCDDEELLISLGIQNGEAVAKTMTIDYVFAAKFMGTSRP